MNTRTIQQTSSHPCATRATAIAALLASATMAAAQRPFDFIPEEMRGVEVTQRLNESIPLDLEFIDEKGEPVRLGDFFDGTRPVILTLNYFTCPQLCHLTLSGLVQGLHDVEWTIGKEFQIVTVTINPEETPEHAQSFKRSYAGRYGRDEAKDGWHFLVGEEANIKALAEAIGFGYRYDEKSGEYAHPSSIQFITPDGRISQYMIDLMFEPRDLRFALVEASQGSIGTVVDRFLLLTCFQYDPDSNSYAPAAWKIMRTGGALTVIIVAIGIITLAVRGSINQRRHGGGSGTVAIGGAQP